MPPGAALSPNPPIDRTKNWDFFEWFAEPWNASLRIGPHRLRIEIKLRMSAEIRVDAAQEARTIPMLSSERRAGESSRRNKRWGMILAGGDGTRLRSLTRFISGDDRPKQFCPLLDDHTLLAHTVRRAGLSICTRQILFALTRAHREFYSRELDGFRRNWIVQPANKGTAPPIAFSVLSIEQIDRDALIAIIPSDHCYSEDARLTDALESAFEIAAKRPESVVLLGASPERLEVEYGWIELGAHVGESDGHVRSVFRFWEKPSIEIALTLLDCGAVWNTFVMVGHVRAFWEILARTIPKVMEEMRHARLWTGSERHVYERVYNRLPPTDFSSHVLAKTTDLLLALQARNLGWSDLGSPERVLAAVEKQSLKPRWFTAWMQADESGRPEFGG